MSQLHFQGRGFRLTGTPVSITPVSRCTLLRYIQVDPGRVRRLHDTFHRVAGYARRPCDVPLAEAEMLQPEDFAVFGHVTSIGKPVATLRRAIPL